ncbi:dephospho-CoA kinase [bacterium]|nr:dephospho-CoA kinase [bacterium]
MPDSITVPAWHRKVVAVTGSIGSGKSSVTKLFRELGAYTLASDDLARRVVAANGQALKKISETFGAGLISKDGVLDRQALGKIVFLDPAALKKLEAITHPVIRALADEEFTEAFKNPYPLFVYDVPLLFEAGLAVLDKRDRQNNGFKKIIVVYADRQTCIRRLVEQRGMSLAEAEQRIAAQLPIEEKIKYADIVIDNSGTLDELKFKVLEIFKELTTHA